MREKLQLAFPTESELFNQTIFVNSEWPSNDKEALSLFEQVFKLNSINKSIKGCYVDKIGTVRYDLRIKNSYKLFCSLLRPERPPFIYDESKEKIVTIGSPTLLNSHSYLVSYLWKSASFNCNVIIDRLISTMRDIREIEYVIAFDIHKDTDWEASIQNYTLLTSPSTPASNPATPPTKEGRWILEREPDGKPYCFHCSECDSDFSYAGINTAYSYCPLCGSKMNDKEIFENERYN